MNRVPIKCHQALTSASMPTSLTRKVLRSSFLNHPRIQVTQGPTVLASYGLRRMIPNRSHRIPSDWQRQVDLQSDELLISVSASS